MSYFIDTHCHLDLFKNIQTGITAEDSTDIKSITVTNAPSFFTPNKQLFFNAKNIRTALGFHPQLVAQYQHEEKLFEELISQTRYVGEIGLDGSVELKNSFPLQKKIFENILRSVSKSDGKILTIHSRNAVEEVIECLVRNLKRSGCKVILHWYSGSISDLKSAILKNYYFSINHKMTESKKGREIIKYIPKELLLTETESPFTFSSSVANRLDSLKATVSYLQTEQKAGFDDIKTLLYSNFKTLLS
ncbi:MAG TPA: Qat anti-phage system TatD family nuclease QatD [Chitinophagaceae bacterium]|nr:Qat anti-phage system TatD family nuclease QatD [Chitinophagaceae bacterium]